MRCHRLPLLRCLYIFLPPVDPTDSPAAEEVGNYVPVRADPPSCEMKEPRIRGSLPLLWLGVLLALAPGGSLAKETAFVEVVLFESSPNGDYKTHTTELQGRFSRAGATISAEGEIVQVRGGDPLAGAPPYPVQPCCDYYGGGGSCFIILRPLPLLTGDQKSFPTCRRGVIREGGSLCSSLVTRWPLYYVWTSFTIGTQLLSNTV